jgi:5-methylcytosine-specific restriction protein B
MPDISLLNLNQFENATNRVGLTFSKELISRFCASLITKRFLILTGLTGSGKTKIAQSFAEWICESDVQYKIIPVGADWTNREPLLGYPNGLEDKKYVSPDNGALELIINAIDNPNLPFFMILDEMNLSHVERYFADFLSVMESDKNILLYSGDKRGSIPKEIEWPQNLFIIGTVNIDESTYMFSPKVLDRANVIEFRLNHADLKNYFDEVKSSSNESLRAEGKEMAAEFLKLSIEKSFITNKEIQKILLAFFDQLSKVGAEFGYRTAKEIQMLTDNLIRVDSSINQDDIIDIAIMQKLLPKLHGSRSKLIKVLDELLKLCAPDLILEKLFTEDYNPTIKYKLSYEKIKRMYKNAIDNGFASYAEA